MKNFKALLVFICASFSSSALAHTQVAITGVNADSFVHGFACWDFNQGTNGNPITALTVPANKTFVLTDILPDAVNGATIYHRTSGGSVINYIVGFNQTPLHLTTGFKFVSASDETVVTVTGDSADGSVGCVSLSGYIY